MGGNNMPRRWMSDAVGHGQPAMPKRPYSPDQSIKFKASGVSGSDVSQFSQVTSDAPDIRKNNDQPPNFPVDSSVRSYSTFDCTKSGLCSSAYKMTVCQQDPAAQQTMAPEKGKIHLPFDDFYCLMKLKIAY